MVKFITRKEYHAKKGKKVFWKQDCPFCDREEKKDYMVWDWKHWFILIAKWPYTGNAQHLMACPKEHICFSEWLQAEHWTELQEVHKFCKTYFWNSDYFQATRETMGNRSVEHYHLHFIAGRLQGKYLRNMLMNQGFPVEEYLSE